MDTSVEKIRALLTERNVTALQSILTNIKCDDALELIPDVVKILNSDIEKNNSYLFRCCEQLLDVICESSGAEDVLLQVIQEIENTQDDVTFFCLIKPLQKALLQIPEKRINTFAWGLNSISFYLNRIDTPNGANLDEDDALLMDCDPLVERITYLYSDLLAFYDPVIENVKQSPLCVTKKRILARFILNLLGKPLAFLDLTFNDKTKSKARRIAENICLKLIDLNPDIYRYLDYSFNKLDNDLIAVIDLPVAILFRLVLCEHVAIESTPKIYNALYVFQNTIPLVVELFKYENQLTIAQGLRLIETTINNLKGLVLPYHLLDLEIHRKFCLSLSNIITFNVIEKNRKTALKVFTCYLFHFDERGRYLLIYNLIGKLQHTGLIGHIITQYKEMLAEELDKTGGPHSKYFKRHDLFILLSSFCHLHQGEQTDLIEIADQIIATLNLLRFLVIRDKSNVTGVRDYFKIFETSYLEPLKRALMLSKAHYELKVKELEAEQAKGDKSGSDSVVSVTVAGQKMPELPINEKMNILLSSLTAFDVMESLLARLNECLEVGFRI